jgi:tetratricopeptide (TPR) repeat protein
MLFKKYKISLKNLIFIFVCLPVFGCFAQQVVYKSQNTPSKGVVLNNNAGVLNQPKSTETTKITLPLSQSKELDNAEEVIVVNKTAPVGVDINFLPLFGGFIKTENQLIADQLFLMDCDKSFNTREEASKFFAEMGWEYLEEGDKNNAIKRFNFAFLLNEKNVDAYWGLGVVEYQSRKTSQAIDLFNKGIALSAEPNFVMIVDLATIYLQIAMENSNSVFEISKAKELLYKSIKIQPNYTTAYMQLALVNILDNQISDAWEAFHQGYAQNPKEINNEILSELLKRQADPKGIFK